MWEAAEKMSIVAPQERVWAVVADIEGHPQLAGSGEVRGIRLNGPIKVGSTFEGDVATGEVGTFVSSNTVDCYDPPREMRWTSMPPLRVGQTEDHRIMVRWAFVLSAIETGTDVEHSFRILPPKVGAEEFAAFIEKTDRVATVRKGMRQTLENLRRAAED